MDQLMLPILIKVPSFQSSSQYPSFAQAYIAFLETVSNPCWYTDSGATHHVITDLSNLATRNEYSGMKKLHIGNGSNMFIAHTGFNIVSC